MPDCDLHVRMFFDWDDIEATIEEINHYVAQKRAELSQYVDSSIDERVNEVGRANWWTWYITRMRPPRYPDGYGEIKAKVFKRTVAQWEYKRYQERREILFRNFTGPMPILEEDNRSEILFRRFERITYPHTIWVYGGGVVIGLVERMAPTPMDCEVPF